MAYQPLVYVAVLNWNGYELVERCLHLLNGTDYAKFKVFIIDNGSNDDSVARIRAELRPQIMICSGYNRGYAGGNEMALQHAQMDGADLLWILNPDALVEVDTLSALVAAYQQHGPALYGSVPVDAKNHVNLRTWELDPNGKADLRHPVNISGEYSELFPGLQTQPVATLSGSSLLIPMMVIEKYGFMDTSFFLYSEESDYCLRLNRQGINSYLVPKSVVRHQTQGTHKHHPELKPVIIYYQTRNRLVLLRRYADTLTFIKMVLLHFAYVGGWLLATLKHGPRALKTAWFTLWGILDALINRMGRTFDPGDYLDN
jgi:GT2 family glycosyltransferase